VVEHARRLLAIEVKLTEQPGFRDTHGLRTFLDAHPTAGGVLLHGGVTTQRLNEQIIAIPWTQLT
jgi:hypothetical protein